MIGGNVLAIDMLILKVRFKLKIHTKVACQHIQFSPRCARRSLMHTHKKLVRTQIIF